MLRGNLSEEVVILGDVASERALWQLVEMPRESCLDEAAQRKKRVLGSNVPYAVQWLRAKTEEGADEKVVSEGALMPDRVRCSRDLVSGR